MDKPLIFGYTFFFVQTKLESISFMTHFVGSVRGLEGSVSKGGTQQEFLSLPTEHGRYK